MNIIKLLRRSPLFSNFDDTEMNAVFDCIKARLIKYPKGVLVVPDGNVSDELGVLVDGNLIKFITKANGERQAIDTLSEGSMFNEYEAFAGTPCDYSIASVNDVTILYIAKQSIIGIAGTITEPQEKLLSNLVAHLSTEILRLKSDSSYLIIKSMRVKIAKLIYEKYQIQGVTDVKLNMNRNEMAEYLNVSRPSMSREMIRMRTEGIIDFWKDKIKIKNLDKLMQILK